MTDARRSIVTFSLVLGVAITLSIGLAPPSARAVTRTWDGGVGGTGTDLGLAANWSGDTLPSQATPDTAQWDGTAAGPLALVYTAANSTLGGAAGNSGIILSLTATQTAPLNIDSGTNTNALRIDDITIAAGAGAFSLGDNANVFNLTLGGSGGQTHTWTNNSANTATINSEVAFGLGGGGNHQLEFSGSGTWAVTNTIGGNISVRAIGTGSVDFSGNLSTGGVANLHVAGASGVPVFNIATGTINLSNNGNGSILLGNLAANTTGVFNQSGGSVSVATNLIMGSSGATNYGFYNKTGGTFTQTNSNRFRIGQGGGAGSAMLFYHAGGSTTTSVGIALNDTAGATAGTGGAAVLYVSDGTMNSTVGSTGLGIGGRQGQSEATIAGTGIVTLTGPTSLGGSVAGTPAAGDAGRVAVLNLGTGSAGGTLQTSAVVRDTNNSPVGYLNFNGGTLKAQTANATFMTGLTQATVHSAGGTIDNNGVAITVGQNLVAPTGNGLTSIGVTGATGYKGAPYVQITGGTPTTPATAVANLDGSGNVTSITITNPGSGYTAAPTISLVGGGGAAGILTPTLGAVASGGMTFKGNGTTTLTGASTYTGTTNIDDFGKLVVNGSLSGPVSVNAGTLDGSGGSVGATTIADDPSNHLANGNGATGTLTLSSLTFAGDAIVDVRTASPGIIVTGALSTNPGNGTVTINPTSTSGVWSNGPNNLISYGSFGGSILDFTLGTVTGTLNSRQAINGLVINGNNIALQIDGDSPKWTGLDNGNWVVGPTGANRNWKLITGGTSTDYIDGDSVLFDDSVTTGTTAVDITAGSVSPTSTTFNNSTKNYTLAGSGGGIAGSGTLTKNGTGSVTISASNSYTGLTTINAGTLTLSGANSNNGGTQLNGGTLNANNANALGSGPLTIAAGGAKTLNNTSGGAIVMTDNITQAWNDDFTFTGSSNLDMGNGVVTLGGAGTSRTLTFGGGVLGVGRIASTTHGLSISGPGTLVITTTAASNINGALDVGGGSTLRINTGVDAGTTNDFIATSLTGSGLIENGGGVERWLIIDGATDSAFSGLLQDGSGGGSLGLSKRGASMLTISTSNPFTGATTINGGTLRVTGALSGTSSTTIGAAASAAVLQVSSTQAVGSNPIFFDGTGNASTARLELSGNISLNNNITLPQRNNTSVAIQNISGNNTLSGPINVVAGGNNARIQSDAGLLTLSGGLATTTTANRTVTLQGAGDGVVTGIISSGSGTINIAKEGAGTWSLNANDTYTGTTTVSGGTLLVNGNHTGAGAVSVASGATLGGSGTIDTSATNASVTVAAGGSLSPGTSAGTLTFKLGTGSLDVQLVNSGGFKFELGDPMIPTASDRVILESGTLIAGTLDFSDFTFSTLSGATAGVYKLFDAASPMAAALGGTVSGSIGAFTGTLSLDNTNFDVLLTLAGGGLAGDYNNDGKVNAADYVLWRKNPGAFGGPGGYATWRANFGNPPGSGSSLSSGGVPEPGTLVLVCLGSLAAVGVCRTRRKQM